MAGPTVGTTAEPGEVGSKATLRLGGLLVVAVLAVVGLLEARAPGYFLWDDNASFYLPAYTHNQRALFDDGALAHLNLHQYLGQAWLGNGQSAVLYPPVYAATAVARWLFGDLRHTLWLLAAGHLVAAAIGMVLLLRRTFGAPRAIATLSALTWATLPFVVLVSKGWIFVAYAAAFLPWNLLALERLLAKPSFGRLLALAAVKVLFFFQGYVQYAILAALFDGIWLVGRWLLAPGAPGWPKRLGAYVGVLIATGLGAAPMLVPMLEVKARSAYRASALRYEEFVSNALAPASFVRAQGWRFDEGVVHQGTGAIFYLGLPLLAALMLVVWTARRSGGRSPATIAAVAAIVAWICSTEAYGLLYRVPLLSSFRWPFKFFLLFAFFGLLAAVGGLVRLAARSTVWHRAVVAVLVVGLLAQLTILTVSSWARPFGPYHVDRPVDAIVDEVAETVPFDEGRVLSMWQRHRQGEMWRHLTLAYASLVGARHLGGYDPLIAAENLELALGLEYSNVFRYALDERVLTHLSAWGVRFLITATDPRADAQLASWPQLRQHHRDPRVTVFENTAALPIVSFRARPATAVPFVWRTNGVVIETGGRTGVLRVALAPLPWWRWSIDGVDQGAVTFDDTRQMVLPVPAGAKTVEVVYRDAYFRLGAGLAATCVAVALVLGWRRRQGNSRSGR